jgi:tetratricopeptide (TPR) repeat protein
MRSNYLLLLAAALFPLACFAQDMPGMSGMEHHHHHDAAEMGKLGKVHFSISCLKTTQAPFERGIALLHSFGYTEAEQQFTELTLSDPKCAMAYWGAAMAQYREIWGRPDPRALKQGSEAMTRAESLAVTEKATPRERAYIDALNGFFVAAPNSFQTAANGYAASMKALHAAYPEDVEAAAFYALAVLASEAPDDTSLDKERTALAVLLPLFHTHPEHPGLAHYIIHTCDTPKLAAQGLDAAKVYAKIAPSSAHALHMPGHIFARLGMWPEDIDSNEKSVAASNKAIAEGQPGGAHQMHAEEFLIYAYLQVGEDEKARLLTSNMQGVGERMAAMPGMDDMKSGGRHFTNEMNGIFALEMHDWKGAEKLEPQSGSSGLESAATWWANCIGAARSGDKEAARKALEKADTLLEEMKRSPRAYMVEGAFVPRTEMAAWSAYADGSREEAITLMRKAADRQDLTGQNEVDIPAREMLGDLLMLENEPLQAIAEYKTALMLSPNRLNGLLSAGEAEESVGNMPEAGKYYAAATTNTRGGVYSKRQDLQHAVSFAPKASHLGIEDHAAEPAGAD